MTADAYLRWSAFICRAADAYLRWSAFIYRAADSHLRLSALICGPFANSLTSISRFYLCAAADRSMLGTVMTCPECQGAGFVVGEESGGRERCLSCQGRGVLQIDEQVPTLVGSGDVRPRSTAVPPPRSSR
jgi:hypothetical protein